MTTQELRAAAVEETKIGGDANKAIALAILYLAEVIDRKET